MDRRRMFCVHCVECQAQSGIEKVRRKIFALLSLREGHALADAEKGQGNGLWSLVFALGGERQKNVRYA